MSESTRSVLLQVTIDTSEFNQALERVIETIGSPRISDHLWIEDGERIVCTHCGIGLKEGDGNECPDND